MLAAAPQGVHQFGQIPSLPAHGRRPWLFALEQRRQRITPALIIQGTAAIRGNGYNVGWLKLGKRSGWAAAAKRPLTTKDGRVAMTTGRRASLHVCEVMAMLSRFHGAVAQATHTAKRSTHAESNHRLASPWPLHFSRVSA